MQVIGELCALGSALTWATAVILFRRSESASPQAINLFKNVLAVFLLGVTLPIAGVSVELDRSNEDWARLIASGVLGLAFADTLVLFALRRLGPALLAIVDTAYAPTFVLVSILALGEPVTVGLIAGGTLVVAGVLAATTSKDPTTAAPRDLRIGVAAGLTGIVSMALGVVLVKPVLERSELIEVTFIRMAAGAIGQIVWMIVTRSGLRDLSVFRPSRTWQTLLPASILSSYVAMLLWLGGFKWANASAAAILNQMSAVFVILLSRIILRESVSRRRATGACVAILGACVVLVWPA